MRHQALLVAVAVVASLLVGTALATPALADDGDGDHGDDTDADVALYEVPDGADDVAAAAAAVENGTAAPASRATLRDDLLVVVGSERLAADLEDREGSTTERLVAALEGEADLRVVQTNPAPSRSTKVAALGPENVTARRDGSRVYVRVDLAAVGFARTRVGEDDPEPLRDGERYAVTFGYDLSAFPDGGPEVELYRSAARFDAGAVYDPLPPERVNRSVTVNVEPETELAARLVLPDRNRTAHARPGPDDARRVTLDLRDVDPGTPYVLELRHDGDAVNRDEGTVREPSATLRDPTVAEVSGWTAVNVTATLSHGGEVRVLNGEGERLGWASMPAGNETRVSVRLRGSADELVVRAARQEGAAAEYYPAATTTLDVSDRRLRDPIRSPTATPETVTADGDGGGPDDGTETEAGDGAAVDDQAGFGAGVAVAALVTALLLGRRRQR